MGVFDENLCAPDGTFLVCLALDDGNGRAACRDIKREARRRGHPFALYTGTQTPPGTIAVVTKKLAHDVLLIALRDLKAPLASPYYHVRSLFTGGGFGSYGLLNAAQLAKLFDDALELNAKRSS